MSPAVTYPTSLLKSDKSVGAPVNEAYLKSCVKSFVIVNVSPDNSVDIFVPPNIRIVSPESTVFTFELSSAILIENISA